MGALRVLCVLLIFAFLRIDSVPPEACFANFRWDDCGQSAVPVMYYWKPGSRCEVGFWRGCLPNPNMFQDEYECVTTCIFTERAMPEDYHGMNRLDFEVYDVDDETTMETATENDDTTEITTTMGNITTLDVGNSTSAGNMTGGNASSLIPTTIAA